jgi:mono/diheme cytochrome c family protein
MVRAAKLIIPVAFVALLAAVIDHDVRAQQTEKTVDEGVYTDVQATRGAAAYDAGCARCHRGDLGGADGPPLKEDRFTKNFAGKDLKTFYTKIATTMPRGGGGSMTDSVYLDIVAHLLRENGFPSGPHELTATSLEGVRLLPARPKPLPPVGDFSYVQIVGCLAPGTDGSWLLTNGSDPVSVAAPGSAGFQTEIADRPLGTGTFHLLDAIAYSPETHKGRKVSVRGLLIRIPGEQRVTISALETLAADCSR